MAESRYNMQGIMRNPCAWDVLDCLTDIGEKRGKTVSQMALAWLLSHPSVTSPIIGPRTMGHLQDNLGAVGLRLTGAELSAVDQAGTWRKQLWELGFLDVDSARV